MGGDQWHGVIDTLQVIQAAGPVSHVTRLSNILRRTDTTEHTKVIDMALCNTTK